MLGGWNWTEKNPKMTLIGGLQWLGKDIPNTGLQVFFLGQVLFIILISSLVIWMMK